MTQPTTRQRVKGGPGGAQWLALGGIAVVALVLAFALGILVGRQSARPAPPAQAAAEPLKRPAPPPRRSGLVDRAPERPPLEGKLTFYQTLTAPLAAQPASTKIGPETPKPRPVAASADPGPAGVPSPGGLARQDKPGVPAREAPPVQRIAADGRRGDWAVQAGAFKDRGQAEGVRRQLAAAGFDAYLLAVPAEGGELRFKVRVGSFKTRDEAVRTADRVRQERSLTAFVTPR